MHRSVGGRRLVGNSDKDGAHDPVSVLADLLKMARIAAGCNTALAQHGAITDKALRRSFARHPTSAGALFYSLLIPIKRPASPISARPSPFGCRPSRTVRISGLTYSYPTAGGDVFHVDYGFCRWWGIFLKEGRARGGAKGLRVVAAHRQTTGEIP